MNDCISGEQCGLLAGLLREQLNEMMTAVQRGDLSATREGALLLRGLCRQLRLARHLELAGMLLGEGEYTLSLCPVELVALCGGLMERAGRVLRVRDIHTDFRTDLTALTLSADPARLEDMLLCLLSNGAAAVEDGGVITLTLERRRGCALLTVSDNGGGVSPAALAGFFDYEEGACDATAPVTLKLGLPLARRIAALHGGLLVADSYPGVGTHLSAALPLRRHRQAGFLSVPFPAGEDAWDKVLVELSDSLPPGAFLPEAPVLR